jgi:tRNA A-37 threonylcarbamoyl transferase component Bud32
MQSCSTVSSPAEICGYRVGRVLSGSDEIPSYLAAGAGGRDIVLKLLDPDCVLKKGILHPNVKERLSRVRELALTSVANLYGIERDPNEPSQAWLIWEYVPGKTFEDYADAPQRSPRELALVARELILTVESLHLQGIVHGALTGRNVIVTPAGTVRLTHVSPLLYNDPAEDMRCVIDLLREAVRRRGQERTSLGRLLDDAMPEPCADVPLALRRLGARLAAFATPGESRERIEPLHADTRQETGPRRRAVSSAVFVTVLALVAGYGIWQAVGHAAVSSGKVAQESADVRPAR